jgi:phage-related minor tail protein
MNNEELNEENKNLKEKIKLLEDELNFVKQKLNTYQCNSKKYYENNKELIIEKVKKYKEEYKYIPTQEQKKKWARNAYLNKKKKIEKEKAGNQNI